MFGRTSSLHTLRPMYVDTLSRFSMSSLPPRVLGTQMHIVSFDFLVVFRPEGYIAINVRGAGPFFRSRHSINGLHFGAS